MLPPQLSEELCSLQLGVERLAFSAIFTAFSYYKRIETQMKRLGGSFDWDRVAYTMNEVCPLYGMDLRVADFPHSNCRKP